MAVQPRLLNPTTVKIKQVNQSETVFDHRRRTPVNFVAKDTEFSIKAQVIWASSQSGNEPMATPVGIDEQHEGYILMLRKDLNAKGKTLQRGDVITKVDDLDVNLYIKRVEYGSHYGGKFTIVTAIFEDRAGQDG